MFRLDIYDAYWCLGMTASIRFRKLPDGKEQKLTFGCAGRGLELSDIGPRGETINTRLVDETEVVKLLDPAWDWPKFELAWQAFAEGMERQRKTA